ncbi:MAG: hypothetical protein K6G75_04490 [Lachnospiraceae bacterium]|nr:hypothetical protein [Lachnospiraceae bacterium]
MASLILGILSIVCCWTPCLNFIFGLVGMILGIVAKKKKAAGPATAGMIISIIGTVISLLIVLIYLILVIISIINNS